MADDVVEVRLSGTHLRGYYDAGGWRAFLKCLSSEDANDRILSEFDELAADTVLYDESSHTHRFLADGFDAVTRFVSTCVSDGIDTTDPMLWLRAHDALVGAARISTCPGLVTPDGRTVPDAIGALALFIDIISRACCDRTRDLAPLVEGTEEEMSRRGWSIRCDIICGRVAAWLSYVDDMGRLAAAVRGSEWDELFASYANARQDSYVMMFTEFTGMNPDGALEMAVFQASSIAAIYDALQQRSYVLSFPDGVSPVIPADVRYHMFDSELFEKAVEAGVAVLVSPETEGVAGYAAVLGVSVIPCIVMWSPSLVEALVRGYATAVRESVVETSDDAIGDTGDASVSDVSERSDS